jgi:hypothetical protein
MRSTRRRLATLATVASIGLLATGCSSDSAKPRDGDGGSGGSGSGAVGTEDTARRQGVKFSGCMRDHGVREFPDPDASGQLTVDGVLNGSSLDGSSPAWKAAIEACRDLQPAGFTGRKRSAQQQDDALAFARCMRENGVKDFPDPVPGGPLIDTNRIPSATGRGAREIPGFQAAQEACREPATRALGDG